MRDFKFRAWDKQRKKMVTDFVIAPTQPTWGAFPIEPCPAVMERLKEALPNKYSKLDKKELIAFDLHSSDYTLTDWANYYGLNNYEIMQFTGLKDKNNKGEELYHKDIVLVLAGNDDGYSENTIGVIEWIDNYMWGIVDKNNEYFCDLFEYVFNRCGGKIGNLYENKKLLKKRKTK